MINNLYNNTEVLHSAVKWNITKNNVHRSCAKPFSSNEKIFCLSLPQTNAWSLSPVH